MNAVDFLSTTYCCICQAFSDTTDSGATFNIMAAGEFGSFAPVRTGLEAGGRPLSGDGLATFGGVRALARYVKIEAVPASGGTITINEVRAAGCYIIPSKVRVLPIPSPCFMNCHLTS